MENRNLRRGKSGNVDSSQLHNKQMSKKGKSVLRYLMSWNLLSRKKQSLWGLMAVSSGLSFNHMSGYKSDKHRFINKMCVGTL